MNDAEYARFMKYVAVREGECWLWTGCIASNGYGRFGLHSKLRYSHRLMLERVLGRAIGDGLETLHSCRNKHCCSPEHLREGTHTENQRQRVLDGTDIKGSKNGRAKLTEAQVRVIRIDTRPYRVIAQEYGVSFSTIGAIHSKRRWAHLT